MKFLLGTDFGKRSDRTVQAAQKLLQETPGSSLVVVYASPVKIPYYHTTNLGIDTALPDEERAFWEVSLEKYKALFYPWAERVSYLRVCKDPVDAICQVARDQAVDTIIVGSHNRGFGDKFLGSTSQGVLSRARVPVLVVK